MNQLLRPIFAEASKQSSPIRAMFETGLRLKKEFGEDAVCDFSIGNPDVPAPKQVKEGMMELAKKADQPLAFGYTPNAGSGEIRELLAKYLSEEQGYPVEAADVMLGVGAGAVMCNVFNSCLEAGDQVLGVAPFFAEYTGWAESFGGTYKAIPVNSDFSFNLPAMEAAITPKTRVVIYNSPHNPTGYVYTEAEIKGLVDILRKKGKEYGRPILLVADEPYRFLTYGGEKVPSVLPLYEYSCVVSSFAKNISLPGERIGYLAACKDMPGKIDFVAAIIAANRRLGVTSAPIIGQELLKYCLGHNTDAETYAKRRTVMADVLTRAGYKFNMPAGAFYFFPIAPGGDDLAFVKILAEQRVLAVQGTAFGMPGYFRLSFCVSEEIIKRSFEGLKKAREIVEGK
ncbi:MAG: pyridoxal phosphate-dependent aminotransferase [Deltaproteobacteria bacterium]|jgi:aspartate aminotransferase|nr:pyridoxal phosphate-dependent aminotransferase [Deltaproteobacteria bacterium]